MLSNAGLVRARRDGRSIIYAINFDAMRDLLVFLTEDCCGGRAEMCAPLATIAIAPLLPCANEQPARPFNVLFLCTGNSARSILGEAILNKIGKGKFVAYSAGSRPKGAVHPQALALLERLGYPTDGLRSKSWDEFAAPGAPHFDFVFTVCDNAANEVCPVWPGQPMTAHWGVPDPAAVQGSEAEIAQAFRDAFLMLQRRIELFANLPVRSLDRMSLKKHLDDIGRTSSETHMA